MIATLTRLFNETSEALGGARANPAKKREIEDNSKKLGALFAKLNSGDISKNASEKLVQLCQSLDNGDFSTALQIQVALWIDYSFRSFVLVLLVEYHMISACFLYLHILRYFSPQATGMSATSG